MALRLWPIHPHPLPDELLSSWMIRIAHGNGFKVHNFYAEFFGREKQIWNRDIDHHAPPWLLEALEERTGVRRERIEQTTLRNLESWVFEQFTENGITKGVLPLGIFHRTRRSFGQQFCPLCISEDPEPYLRRRWRLAWTFICDRHDVFMQDRCPTCERPLTPHRSDFGVRLGVPEKTTMARCDSCKSRLDTFVAKAEPELVQVQKAINKVLSLGFVELGGSTIYSPQFFEGLCRTMRLAPSQLVLSKKRPIFELASLPQRALLLQFSMQLIASWPSKLLMRCEEIPHAYTTLTAGGDMVPYWLQSVLRRNVYLGKSRISIEEAAAMVNIAAGQRVTGSATARVRKLWGRDIGHLVAMGTAVDNETAVMLIKSLDCEMSFATNQSQNLLLRDILMFISARCLKLTLNELTRFEIKDHEVVESAIAKRASWVCGQTREEACTMLLSYLLVVRPRKVEKTEKAFFVSCNGCALSTSGVSARFVRAVTAAGLRDRIPSWERWIS